MLSATSTPHPTNAVPTQLAAEHILQSDLWLSFRAALGYTPIEVAGEGFVARGYSERGRGVRYLAVPYGPTFVSRTPTRDVVESALGSMAQAARHHGLHFARTEPGPIAAAMMAGMGGRTAGDGQPRWTWRLDLTPPEDELRRGLTKGHRSGINAAERKGVTIERVEGGEGVPILWSLLAMTTSARGFHSHDSHYYSTLMDVLEPRGGAHIYVARTADGPIAAALCLDWHNVRYYAHAAQDPVLNKHVGAAAPLCWKMLSDAKASGMTTMDFFGIAPPDVPNHPWAGFTQFKRSFGGVALDMGGTMDIPVARMRYMGYRAAQRIFSR